MKNKLIDLHNALFVELETLQDTDSYTNDDGSYNKEAMEIACMRADKVNEVAGKIIELQNLQLKAAMMMEDRGIKVKVSELLGIEEYK